jgi:glycosyltransferase involved in cell wall biosynthesis
MVSERRFNILMLDPHMAGGGQVRYVANLAREFTRAGHRVVIGCKSGSVLVQRAAEADCEALPVLQLRGGLRPRAWSRDVRALLRFIREQRPDLIHVNGSQDHWTAGIANRLAGYPVCLLRTRHNTYTVKDHWPNRLLNREWTDYQIVVCDVVRRELARQRAFDDSRMCSIHNGVDAGLFRPDAAARASARAEFGYAEDDIVLGIAARLVPAKGHEFLLRAVAALGAAHANLRVLVLGQGDLEAPLRQLAGDLGIADRVHWAGFRDDMPRCTQAFDIGVQPSIDCDTSSFSLKEQMAAEKPVVASDYGGLTEILDDGAEGMIVPAGTVEPLTEALKTLCASPERRAAMGVAGRRRVLRDFTVEIVAARTLEAYAEALAVHARRRGGGP